MVSKKKGNSSSSLLTRLLPLIQQCENDTTLSSSDIQMTSLCRLWGGMGHVYKVTITTRSKTRGSDDNDNSDNVIIVKHVQLPPKSQRSFGDERKAKSYLVEANFYKSVASTLIDDFGLQIPTPYNIDVDDQDDDEILIFMSYLQGQHASSYSKSDISKVLQWLATFHCSYWGIERIQPLVERNIVNEIGTYWHLGTRPHEYDNIPNYGWQGRLKLAARAIDNCLKRDSSMQCLVHGDVKDANILVLNNNDNNDAAAFYDFQYCGQGPPTKDLAYYFITSTEMENMDEMLSDYYNMLSQKIKQYHHHNHDTSHDIQLPSLSHFQKSLELAICDFVRFMCGWGMWGNNVDDLVQNVLQKLDNGTKLNSESAYEDAIRRVYW